MHVGIAQNLGRELLTVRHGVTHHRITLTAIEAAWQSGRFTSEAYQRAKWLRTGELGEFPAGSAQKRVIAAVVTPAR